MFREIVFGTEEYRLECLLREEVLRKPLGLSLGDEDLAVERGQLHFGFFEPDGNLVGCVVVVPLSPGHARIRQMAVSPLRQRKGLGKRIMNELEKTLRARGFEHFVLDARSSAAGFYERLGYTVASEEFAKVTVPHIRMEKHV